MLKKYPLLLPRLAFLPSLKKCSKAKRQRFFRKVFLYCLRRDHLSSRFRRYLSTQFYSRNYVASLSPWSSLQASWKKKEVFRRALWKKIPKRSFRRYFFFPRKIFSVPSARASGWLAFFRKNLGKIQWASRTPLQRFCWLRRILHHRRRSFNLTKKSLDRFFKKSSRVRSFSRPVLSSKKSSFPKKRSPVKSSSSRKLSKRRGPLFVATRKRLKRKARVNEKVHFLFPFTRLLFRRRKALPHQRRIFGGVVSSRRPFLRFFVKKNLLTQQTFTPLLLNRYSFTSKELSARCVLWINWLLRCRVPAFERLVSYGLQLRALQRWVSDGIPLDFPGPTDPFRWPTPILDQVTLDPCEMWFYHREKAKICISHLNSLGVSILPLVESSPSTFFLMQRLYRWYFRYYRIHWFFLGRSSIPLRFFPSTTTKGVAASFFFFFRPSWDTFDQALLYDEYYSFEPPQRHIWLTVVFQSFLKLPSHLTKILFFQFLVREVRFWGYFFNTVRQQCLQLPYKKLYHPFFDGEFKYWEDYPLWLHYKLERLYLTLPFLPKSFRSLLYLNTRVLFDFLDERKEEVQEEDVVVAGLLARVDYWFRGQMSYYAKLQKKSSKFSLFRSFFLALRFSRFCYRLPFFKGSVFFRLAKKVWPSFLSSSIFFPPLLKSRFSFLKKKWKRAKNLRKTAVSPQEFSEDLPLMFSFTQEHYWTLLLFWSLSFYFRLQMHHRFFFLIQWLQRSFFRSSLSPSPRFTPWSLEVIFSSVASRMDAIEPSFFLVSFYWSFLKPLEVSQTVKRQVVRQFFFPRESMDSLPPIPFFYKRFNYIRRLPFSDFCHFWSQTANFAQFKIKRHPRQFYGGASREVSVSMPLTYVSSPTKPFFSQLHITDNRVLLHKSLCDDYHLSF